MLNWLTWFRWATLMIALSGACYYGYRTTPWSCMDATVSAYWVAAIGTTGTLIGTIWLATEEKRERSRRELDLALVVCGGIILKISEIQVKVDAVGKGLLETVAGERDNVEWSAEILADLPEIEIRDLAALVVLPDNFATKVAAFLTELDWCKKEVLKRSVGTRFDEAIAHMCVQTGRRMIASGERLLTYKAVVTEFMRHNKCEIV
jgi:hypothetical protein